MPNLPERHATRCRKTGSQKKTLLLLGVLAIFRAPGIAETPEGIDYFESHIRPTLIEHCYKCHSTEADKIKGGLLLDSRKALLEGGESGPAIIPGDPQGSLLVELIEFGDMPPDDEPPLPEGALSRFREWIQMGAPDPRDSPPAAGGSEYGMDIEAGRKFWSFQAPEKPSLPKVRKSAWPRNDIDHFILAKLETENLQPAEDAEKTTLLRRLYYDLTGLPPSFEENEAFLRDRSRKAVERVVDRLLRSPQFGEHWARLWLDLSRYAETGFKNTRFPAPFAYRDWVINAFNNDLPYDEFVRLQLAADHYADENQSDIAALGMLTLGTDHQRETFFPENVDDRIDTVTRTFMGLTVSCARCHDHKFDPIPTTDYYALYGVFNNSLRPLEPVPLNSATGETSTDQFFRKNLQAYQHALKEYQSGRLEEIIEDFRKADVLARYLLTGWDARKASDQILEKLAQTRNLDRRITRRWRDFIYAAIENRDPIFMPWAWLGEVPETEFSQIRGLVLRKPSHELHPLVAEAIANDKPDSIAALATCYARLLERLNQPEPFTDQHAEEIRLVLHGKGTPTRVPYQDFMYVREEHDYNFYTSSYTDYNEIFFEYAIRSGTPFATTLQEPEESTPSHVMIRGNQYNLGEEVSRHFLSVLSDGEPEPFKTASGRLELAEAIADPSNPLTARVMVNRVWQRLFGEGIVRTTSDFGTRGAAPTHPELLDYLAVSFVENGWSLKSLIRSMVFSRTYQQSAENRFNDPNADPENHWLSHANRRRLTFEEMRDSLLSAAGRLEERVGGSSFAFGAIPSSKRRSIYGHIERQNVDTLLKSFDFSDPEQHTPSRHSTIVPQQALFLLNSPFIEEQARALADRCDVEDSSRRIDKLYQLALGRKATPSEIVLASEFIGNFQPKSSEPEPQQESPWSYGTGKLDIETGKLVEFSPFLTYKEGSWQKSSFLPHPITGNAQLTANGGTPGDTLDHSVVRRWISPHSGAVQISGKLEHKPTKHNIRTKLGDGVRGWIISSMKGLVGTATAYDDSVELLVKELAIEKGETIDFVVDARANFLGDRFTWAPTIEMTTGNRARQTWSSEADFSGPRSKAPTPWQALAQVILLTNEFAYID